MKLRGVDLVCYSNRIESVGLRRCSYDHLLNNKAYSSDITVTNIYKSFIHKMAAKTSSHRYGTKLRHCHPMYKYRILCVCRPVSLSLKMVKLVNVTKLSYYSKTAQTRYDC